MAYCTNCGAPRQPGAKFCEHCGTRLEEPLQRTDSTPEAQESVPEHTPDVPVSIKESGDQASLFAEKAVSLGKQKSPDHTLNQKLFLFAGILCLLLVLLTIFSGKKAPNPLLTPYAGTYSFVEGTRGGVTIPIDHLFDGDFTLTLKENGNCVFFVEGVRAWGEWEPEEGGGLDVEIMDMELDGTLKDGVLTLYNVLDSGVDARFLRVDEE